MKFCGAIALLAVACAPAREPMAEPTGRPLAVEKPAPLDTLASRAESGQVRWAARTRSPQPKELPPGTEADLLARCGAGDAALESLAWRLAHREARSLPPPDPAELSFFLRARGAPYVWPRTWTLRGDRLRRRDLEAGLDQWLASQPDSERRRCGIALLQRRDGTEVAAVAMAQVLADVRPFPTRARLGQWLTFDAAIDVEATHAKVVLLGPRGAPRTVPTQLDENRARARFAVDQTGQWRVQLLATVPGGPRPVAEALVFVDSTPPETFASVAAPGEAAGAKSADPSDALFRMLSRARASEGLPALRRDAALDAVALEHAAAMKREGRLTHDLGRGTVDVRLARRGIFASLPGENLAHAQSPRRAHRALWSSPSHRANLLEARFGAVGVGAVQDSDGSTWICQVFTEALGDRRAASRHEGAGD